jgi:DNA-binding CsgD family transcriptional regulator
MGRFSAAYAEAAEASQLATELGQSAVLTYALVCLGWVEAAQGREQDCRSHVATALKLAGPLGTSIAAYAMAVLGLLEFGLGHGNKAVKQLEALRQWCDKERIEEPAVFQFTPNLIEAYVHTGDRADAETALVTFHQLATRTQRPWAIATAARCQGVLVDADFDRYFQEALQWHDRAPTPFERARTELCYGERLRRARRRGEAREQLRSALTTFEQLGAKHWVERARRELRATGETAHRRAESGSENLTLQELQVALKVAAGATNREVAAALFLSPKTIEVHLGRIYSKLGLRSRTELARCFAQEGGDSFGSGRPELSHHSTSSD